MMEKTATLLSVKNLHKISQGIFLLVCIVAFLAICSGFISFVFGESAVKSGAITLFSMFIKILIWALTNTFLYFLPPIVIYVLIQFLIRHPFIRFLAGIVGIYLFWILSGGFSFSISSPIDSVARIVRLVFQIYFLTVLIIPQSLVRLVGSVASFLGGIIVSSIPVGVPMTSIDDIAAMLVLTYFITYLNIVASFVKKIVAHSLKIKSMFGAKEAAEFQKTVALPEAIETPKAAEPPNDTRTAAELLKDGFALLKRSDFGRAGKLFERILEANPKASSAYIGLLMAEQKAKDAQELVRSSILLEKDTLFEEALKFANPKTKQILEKYVQINRAKNKPRA